MFTPMVQLKLLDLIEQLARAGPFNLESLTSAGIFYTVYFNFNALICYF
jgi:hypothetical protein